MLPVLLLFVALTWFTPFLPPQEPPGYEFGRLWKTALWAAGGWACFIGLLVLADIVAKRRMHWFARNVEIGGIVFFAPVFVLQGMLVALMAAYWSDSPVLLAWRDLALALGDWLFALSGGFANLIDVSDRTLFPQYRAMGFGLHALLYGFAPVAFLLSTSLWLKPALSATGAPDSAPIWESALTVLAFLAFCKGIDSLVASTVLYPALLLFAVIAPLGFLIFISPDYHDIYSFLVTSIIEYYLRYLILAGIYILLIRLLTRRSRQRPG